MARRVRLIRRRRGGDFSVPSCVIINPELYYKCDETDCSLRKSCSLGKESVSGEPWFRRRFARVIILHTSSPATLYCRPAACWRIAGQFEELFTSSMNSREKR